MHDCPNTTNAVSNPWEHNWLQSALDSASCQSFRGHADWEKRCPQMAWTDRSVESMSDGQRADFNPGKGLYLSTRALRSYRTAIFILKTHRFQWTVRFLVVLATAKEFLLATTRLNSKTKTRFVSRTFSTCLEREKRTTITGIHIIAESVTSSVAITFSFPVDICVLCTVGP